jgi:hypothetical protein
MPAPSEHLRIVRFRVASSRVTRALRRILIAHHGSRAGKTTAQLAPLGGVLIAPIAPFDEMPVICEDAALVATVGAVHEFAPEPFDPG